MLENVDKFTMISLTDLFSGLCFTKEKNSNDIEDTVNIQESANKGEINDLENQLDNIELTETESEKLYRLFGSDDEDEDPGDYI